MPALGMAQDTGIIVAWHKRLGDPVKAGDILIEVETDKTTMEVEAGFDGFLTSVLAEAGVPIPVGDVIAIVSDTSGGAGSAAKGTSATLPSAGDENIAPDDRIGAAQSAEISVAPTLPAESGRRTDAARPPVGRVLASPKARVLARERGIDLGMLVRQGIPQPYHVADLDRATPEASLPASSVSLIRTSVERSRFDGLLSWLSAHTGESVSRAHVWAAFAAGSFRVATQARRDEDIIVACAQFAGRFDEIVLINPDRAGLSDLAKDETGARPQITVHDLMDTLLTDYRPGGGTADPCLTVTNGPDGARLDLALAFDADALPIEEAVVLLTDLAKRIREPLYHLL